MARRLFDLAAIVSLLLFLVTFAGLLPGRREVRVWRAPGKAWFLIAEGGGIYLMRQQVSQSLDRSWTATVNGYGRIVVQVGGQTTAELITGGYLPPRGALGFSASYGASSRMRVLLAEGIDVTCVVSYSGIGIPLWAAAVLTGAAPAAWLVARHRKRRLRTRAALGLCAACGYDLRASKERCPECGVARG